MLSGSSRETRLPRSPLSSRKRSTGPVGVHPGAVSRAGDTSQTTHHDKENAYKREPAALKKERVLLLLCTTAANAHRGVASHSSPPPQTSATSTGGTPLAWLASSPPSPPPPTPHSRRQPVGLGRCSCAAPAAAGGSGPGSTPAGRYRCCFFGRPSLTPFFAGSGHEHGSPHRRRRKRSTGRECRRHCR